MENLEVSWFPMILQCSPRPSPRQVKYVDLHKLKIADGGGGDSACAKLDAYIKPRVCLFGGAR
jgi:hypothetical protein